MISHSHELAHPKKRLFLEKFAQCGIIAPCAKAAGIARRTHYDWLTNDPEYREAFAAAQLDADDALEAEARRRACDTEKPSDTLLIVMLKMRGRFVEKREHTGAEGGPIQVEDMTYRVRFERQLDAS